jgi:hypothetical protein
MNNSKLIEMLKKFDFTEIERLKSFMVSPYFIKQHSLQKFAILILEEYPHFDFDNNYERAIYETIFPDSKFQLQTIQDLMTLMVSSIHSFLHFENYSNDEIESQLRLLGELRSRDFGKEFLRIGKKLKKKLEEGKNDKEYFNHVSKYEDEMDHYFIRQKEHRGFSPYLQNKSDALDAYYFASKFKLASEILNRQNIFAAKYDISFLQEVLDYITQHINRFDTYPSILIYYKIILTMLNPDEEGNFFDLKKLLDVSKNDFSIEELKDMYGYAQNYCIKKINSGEFNYVSELFGLYRKQLDAGIIYDNGMLSQWDYKNIVTTAIRLNEFEWAEEFIVNYKNKIHPDFKEVAYTHNMAYLHYEKKEYKTVLKLLNQFNKELKDITDPSFDDTFYILDSRSLLLKIYYELDEEEPLYAVIESFKLFLRRNKNVADRLKNNYFNLIKYTKNLNIIRQKLELNNVSGSKALIELKHKINAEKSIVNLTWLQSQVEKLEREMKA